jgi:formylglycine-generating enzyme required for sulfatase activity
MKATIKQVLQTLNERFEASIFSDPEQSLNERFEASIFSDPEQFKSALADVPIEVYAKQVKNLLNRAVCDMQAYSRLKSGLANDPFFVDKLTTEMSSEHLIDTHVSRMVLECIAELLGYIPHFDLPSSYREIQASTMPPIMVFVQGGTFMMGATSEQGDECFGSEKPAQKPAHKVTLSDFYIGKYLVTQAQWGAVMGSNPSSITDDLSRPVGCVSWSDVQEFIKKLNIMTCKQYRLPTEAEWEYAARCGVRSRGFKYAGSNDIGEVAWYGGNSGSETHPVGSKRPNELGIYNMSGNVYEWVNDWYGNYTAGATTNPIGPASGSYRVCRGGSWDLVAGRCRVSDRFSDDPGYRFSNSGFRLALSP